MTGRFALRLLLVAALNIAAPAAALGHAVLLGSEPPDGAVLDEPPGGVELRFNEPISPTRVQVLGPGGDVVAGPDAARAENATLIIALPEALDEGTHLVSYRVRSLDGHPVGGSLAFAIGAATEAPPALPPPAYETRWRVGESAARFVQILALFVAAGGALFLLMIEKARRPSGQLQRLLKWTAFVGVGATVIRTGLYGALLHGAAPAGLLTDEVWAAGVAGMRGLSALLAIAALVAVAAALRFARAGPRIGLLVAGIVVAILSFPVTGHAAATEPRWLAMPMLALHIAAVAFWAGSLLPLWLHVRQGQGNELAAIVERFSRRAVVVVAALVAAGVALAWLILDEPADLWTSAYGTLLLGKVGLVVLLIAVAAVNKLSLVPRLRSGDDAARRRLGRNISVEMGLVALIVAGTVALAQSSPPRHAHHDHLAHDGPHHHDHHHHHHEAAPSPPEPPPRYVTTIESGDRQLLLSVQPARPGRNELTIQLTDAAGSVIEPLEVTIDFASGDLGIEPFRREMEDIGGGRFGLTGEEFALPGMWQLRIDALVTEFEKEIFRTEVDIE